MENSVEFNGLFFSKETPKEVMEIISNSVHFHHSKNRFRFWHGDRITGKSWNEENDVTGYIGRSTGTKKIPLLIHNRNSSGGIALLDSCIVKIVDTQSKRVLYQHPTFNQPLFTFRKYDCAVLADDSVYARGFYSIKQAQRYTDFMNGKRMNK